MLWPDRETRILISEDVIDPGELEERVEAARAAVASAADEVLSPARSQLGRAVDSLSVLRGSLHELQAHTAYFSAERLQQAPGLPGRIAYEIKRTVRRFTSWYVEPRWMLQQAVNDDLAQLIETMERAIAQLRDDVDDLAMWRRRVERRIDSDDTR